MKTFDSQTQSMLLNLVSENINQPLGVEICEALDNVRHPSPSKDAREKRASIPLPSVGGGSGVGGPVGKVGDTGKDSRVLFGDYNEDDYGLGAAAGAYAIGKTAKTLADTLDKYGAQGLGDYVAKSGVLKNLPNNFLGQLASVAGSKAISAIPGLGSTLLRNIVDLSASEVLDKTSASLGKQTLKLAFDKSMGSPWIRPVLPGEEKTERVPYDPGAKERSAREDAIAAAKEAEEIKKLRGLGYNIP